MISMFVSGTDSLGGSDEELQTTSYGLSREQSEPTPMPKGYGTVTFPHLLGQSGLVEVVVAAEERGRERSNSRRERRDMIRGDLFQ